jgi:hypothetical protein
LTLLFVFGRWCPSLTCAENGTTRTSANLRVPIDAAMVMPTPPHVKQLMLESPIFPDLGPARQET